MKTARIAMREDDPYCEAYPIKERRMRLKGKTASFHPEMKEQECHTSMQAP